MAEPKKRKTNNWPSIKARYRTLPPEVSLVTFAEQENISYSTLTKKMKVDAVAGKPWQRDLSSEVRKQTAAALLRIKVGTPDGEALTDEDKAVHAAAAADASIIVHHQDLACQLRFGLEYMIDQLLVQAKENVIAVETDKGVKTIPFSLDYGSKVAQRLATSLKGIVDVERKAHGMDEDDNKGDYEQALRELHAEISAE